MLITRKLELEKKRLVKEAELLEKQLLSAPEGAIRFHKDNDQYKWYQWLPNKRIYLSKKNDRELAEKLTLKKYRQEQFVDVKKRIRAIDSFLRMFPESNGAADMLEPGHPGRELLLSSVPDMKLRCLEWQEEPFESNPTHPDQKKIRSRSGVTVRSKSEALILNTLREQNIPVRYECLLEVNGKKFYPDFTLMHPSNGLIFLWEHMGLIDDRQYRSNALSKLNCYAEAGFYPMINLIITCETEAQPLDMQLVMDLIEHFFL